VGNVQIIGAQPYSMRVWLNPDLMYARGLTADDVVSAIQAQNIQVAPGNIGGEPAHPRTELQLTLTTRGRLVTPDEFSRIIPKRGTDGQLVYLGDVAKLVAANKAIPRASWSIYALIVWCSLLFFSRLAIWV